MLPVHDKFVGLTPPAAAVNNAAFTTAALDTRGFRYARVYVYLGALDAGVTALKLQESDALTDANTLTGGTDVPGTVFGTDASDAGSTSVLPSATDDNKCYLFEVDLKGRKRYLDVTLTEGSGSAGAYAVAFALLSRGENEPTTAAQKGIAQLMRVPSL